MTDLKEVTYTGKPGNLCVVVNSDERYQGLPTRGLAWGPFGEDGTFRLIVDSKRYPIIIMRELLPSPATIEQLEQNWHVNTA